MGSTVGVNKVHMQNKCEKTMDGDMDFDKKQLGKLNELEYKDLIISINTSSPVGKTTFGLVGNSKLAGVS